MFHGTTSIPTTAILTQTSVKIDPFTQKDTNLNTPDAAKILRDTCSIHLVQFEFTASFEVYPP